MKVSDYIEKFLSENGIKTVFTVVGGGAMHLNDSLGHSKNLQCIYNHHEQASAMAAEAYFRLNGEIAAVCVTSGPGAINALNGVAGAYQDSIPMIILSGQCKSSLTIRKNNLELRCLGPQEFDIVSCLDKFAKYSEMILDPTRIRYCLEKALFIAKNGRPGPCWLDIPVDIQASQINEEELDGYSYTGANRGVEYDFSYLLKRILNSSRPVIYAGNGIRIANACQELHKVSEKYSIPIVTCWNSIDLIDSDNLFYAGRAGTMGDRAGNFAIQNSDLIIAVGTRLNTYQVGYQIESWARDAYIVYVDIDELELTKPTIRVDYPICLDARVFFNKLLSYDCKVNQHDEWIKQCQKWKNKYPVVTEKHYKDDRPINVYAFFDYFSKKTNGKVPVIVSNGSASVVGSQAYYIHKNQRFIMNCGISSMGYDLPAAIGVCIANKKNEVICIAGDGSIQMNIQELQTIVTNKLPIKIIVINNNGYHQIRITQSNLFNKQYVGMGPESGDLGFPDFKKIAFAYEIPFRRCDSIDNLDDTINWMENIKSFCMIEIVCGTNQIFEPKSATKRLEDGSLYSPPLEDLAPFLSREELKENMIIPMWDEK